MMTTAPTRAKCGPRARENSIMNKLVFSAAIVAISVSSFAQVFDMGNNLEHRSIDVSGGAGVQGSTIPVYEDMGGTFSAFAANTNLGFEDYNAIGTDPVNMVALRFIGGVTTAGTTLNFAFFNPDTSPATNFNVTFGTAGNFIWTITVGSIIVPNDGILQITGVSGATGRWFMSDAAPTVGSTDFNYGMGSGLVPQRNGKFAIDTVPEPASMIALGLGLAGAIARKRKK